MGEEEEEADTEAEGLGFEKGNRKTFNFFEKEKRFHVWGKNIADIFSDVSFQKSSVFFSDYSWLK